jgi:hypothetical protein
VNINMLRDADNDAGFYAAACAADPLATWRGASLQASGDGGVNYSALISLTAEATMGYTTNALANFQGGNVVDELNSINVTMRNGSPSSTTYSGLLVGTNVAIVGDEIIHFRDAALEVNGSYTIRGLLRGRRGSEYAMAQHAIGDRFIVVSAATIFRVPQDTAGIGMTRLYKAVSAGTTLAAATEKTFTNLGTGLKPYACVHLGGGRNAAGDVTLNWVARTRISGEWRDAVDVPVGEASEGYVVEIYSSSAYTTIMRTISGLTSPSATYSVADQVADFGSQQSDVYFRVFKLSAVVGPGHAASGHV